MLPELRGGPRIEFSKGRGHSPSILDRLLRRLTRRGLRGGKLVSLEEMHQAEPSASDYCPAPGALVQYAAWSRVWERTDAAGRAVIGGISRAVRQGTIHLQGASRSRRRYRICRRRRNARRLSVPAGSGEA